MILTDIGEVGVDIEGCSIVLRPSLYAMSQLGSPAEIVARFVRLMQRPEDDKAAQDQFGDAYEVLMACAGDQELDEAFGFFDERLVYHKGHAEYADIILIAQCLLKHGIVGVVPSEPRRKDQDKQEFLKEFSARDFAAHAMAHLGLCERDAWNMTMTGLGLALKAKFPLPPDNSPGARAPSKEDHDKTMAWYDQIKAERVRRS